MKKVNVITLLLEHKKTLCVSFFLVLIFAGFEAILPYSFSFIIDNAIIPKNLSLLIIIIALLGLGSLIAVISQIYRDYIYLRFSSKFLSNIRERTFDHVQDLSMDFYTGKKSSTVIARFSTDLSALEQLMTYAPNYFLIPALNVIINTALLFVIDIKLALLSMLIFPAALVGPYILTPMASKAGNTRKKTEAKTLAEVQTTVSSQSVIKALNLQELGTQFFSKTNQRFSSTMFSALFLSAMVDRTGIIAVKVLQVAVLAVGCFMTFYGTLPVGQLVAFLGLFIGMSYSLITASAFIPMVIQGKVSIDRINELLDDHPTVNDVKDAKSLEKFEEEIRFSDVEFGYTPDMINLNKVSFSIKKNTSVAFVGSSGCGKSTILNLVMRFYDPRSGKVTIDGQDIKEVTQHSLREKLGIVLQDNILFNIPIMENLKLARLDATTEEIYEAAKQAEIHDFITSLPNKYNTLAGERGGQLSGGQRQRVAIARALLRGGDILILDEATSALDPVSEAEINKTLANIAKQGKTILSVTHRLTSAVDMDTIFVMDKGNIIEQGSHSELLKLNKKYKEMWDRQNA